MEPESHLGASRESGAGEEGGGGDGGTMHGSVQLSRQAVVIVSANAGTRRPYTCGLQWLL